MEEFLKREAMTGNIRHQETGKVVFPPGNRTDWSGRSKGIFQWLREVSYVADEWDPDSCMAVFPASASSKDVEELHVINYKIQNAKPKPDWPEYVGKPTPVDAPVLERLKENWGNRGHLCIYDEDMQAAQITHFPTDSGSKYKTRMLTYFYAFLIFQDWNHDLWMRVSLFIILLVRLPLLMLLRKTKRKRVV